jgi:PAS domain S-box-containing protein
MSSSRPPRRSEISPELLLSKILDEVPGVVWTTDPQLRFTSSHGATLADLGEQPNEVVGLSLAEYLKDADVRDATIAAHRRALAGETVVLEREWGSQTIQATIKPLRDEQDAIVGCIGISHDITAHKQANDALRESEALFRQIFERGPLGMVLVSADELRMIKVNHAFAEMLGYAPEELVGKTLFELTPPDYHGASQVFRKRLVDGEISSAKWEKQYVTRDGRLVWARATAVCQPDRNGKLYGLAMIEGIADQKKAEQRLHEKQENLKRVLNAYDRDRQLISYEIHDGLAQQLAGALMQLDVYRQAKDSEAAQQALATAQQLLTQGLAEARRLISDLRPPVLDESGVLAAIEHLIHDQTRQSGLRIVFRHEVRFERLAPPLENALFRIAQESVTNVAHHSRSDRCLVKLTQHERHVRLVIRDWGVGFDTDSVRDGAFGLRGIRERARLLGGKAAIRSAANRGTRVVVELPLLLAEGHS